MPDLKAHLVLACDRDDVQDGKLKCFLPGAEKPKWVHPARGYGANGPGWGWQGGDTPPGRYRCGVIYIIQEHEKHIYGDYCVDLIDLENQESGINRAGISIHAGRNLYTPTLGCVRMTPSGLLAVVNTILWARKSTPGSRVRGLSLYNYNPNLDFVDFTMKWVDQL